MRIKTRELTDLTLDWAVALALGYSRWKPGLGPNALYFDTEGYADANGKDKWIGIYIDSRLWEPRTNWSQGGPIIERERFCFLPPGPKGENGWTATRFRTHRHEGTGPTLLIAAMRCYVASRLGFEVDIPEELLT